MACGEPVDYCPHCARTLIPDGSTRRRRAGARTHRGLTIPGQDLESMEYGFTCKCGTTGWLLRERVFRRFGRVRDALELVACPNNHQI